MEKATRSRSSGPRRDPASPGEVLGPPTTSGSGCPTPGARASRPRFRRRRRAAAGGSGAAAPAPSGPGAAAVTAKSGGGALPVGAAAPPRLDKPRARREKWPAGWDGRPWSGQRGGGGGVRQGLGRGGRRAWRASQAGRARSSPGGHREAVSPEPGKTLGEGNEKLGMQASGGHLWS